MFKLYLFNDEYLIFEDTEMNANIVAEQVFNIQVDNFKEVDEDEVIYYVADNEIENELITYWTLDPKDKDILIIDVVKNVCAKINDIILDDYVKEYLEGEEFKCPNS